MGSFPKCLIAACLAVQAILASVIRADAETEIIQFQSFDMDDVQFLRGEAETAEPVTLHGRFDRPEKTGPLPVVILMHGSDGPTNASVWNWGRFLNGLGIATFKIDSYTGRGHGEIYSDQSRVAEFAPVYDAFRAVELLSDKADIHPDRIAVMGFSRGGIGALYSSLRRFQVLYGPDKGDIAAHFPFYPPCNFELADELEIADVPIRAFHGLADNWNPAPRCRNYLERLKAAGADVVFTELPDAHHSYDNPGAPALSSMSEAQTSRECLRREEATGLVNADTGEIFSWKDDCVRYGPSTQYNDAATIATQKAVQSFFEGEGWIERSE